MVQLLRYQWAILYHKSQKKKGGPLRLPIAIRLSSRIKSNFPLLFQTIPFLNTAIPVLLSHLIGLALLTTNVPRAQLMWQRIDCVR